jgi:hypothetical protein
MRDHTACVGGLAVRLRTNTSNACDAALRCNAEFFFPMKNLPDKVIVLLDRFGIDEDVIYIDKETEVDHITEDMVHHILEGCRCVGESERYDVELVEAVTCTEGGFPFVSLLMRMSAKPLLRSILVNH